MAKATLPITPTDDYPYLNEWIQQMADGHHEGLPDFEFGLENSSLDGLERLIEIT